MAKKNSNNGGGEINPILILALLGGGFFLYKKLMAAKPPVPPINNTNTTTTTGSNPNTSGYTWPVVYNRFSAAVIPLQQLLNVTADGIIGPITLAALQEYWPAANTTLNIPDQSVMDNVMAMIRAGQEYNGD